MSLKVIFFVCHVQFWLLFLQLLEIKAYIVQDAEILVAKIFRPSLRSK